MVEKRVQHRKPVIRALNALRWETDVGPQGLLVAGFVYPAIDLLISDGVMNIKKISIVAISAVVFFILAVSIFGTDSTPTQTDDAVTADQKRLDRGEFTEEEKAEIKLEEEREDKAKEELLKKMQADENGDN